MVQTEVLEIVTLLYVREEGKAIAAAPLALATIGKVVIKALMKVAAATPTAQIKEEVALMDMIKTDVVTIANTIKALGIAVVLTDTTGTKIIVEMKETRIVGIVGSKTVAKGAPDQESVVMRKKCQA